MEACYVFYGFAESSQNNSPNPDGFCELIKHNINFVAPWCRRAEPFTTRPKQLPSPAHQLGETATAPAGDTVIFEAFQKAKRK